MLGGLTYRLSKRKYFYKKIERTKTRMNKIKSVLVGFFAILILLIVSGYFINPIQQGEGEIIIKEQAYILSDKLNRDLDMVEMFSESTARRVQTFEQEASRGKRDGLIRFIKNHIAFDNQWKIDLYGIIGRSVTLNFNLKDSREGTILRYQYELKTPAPVRVFGRFFNVKNSWERDLDKWLNTFKNENEKNVLALINGYYIRQRDEIERIFVIKRSRVPYQEMNEFTVTELNSLDFYLQAEILREHPVSTMYYDFDDDVELTDMAVGVRVGADVELPPKYQMKYVARGPVIYTRHYGHVRNTVYGHAAIQKYLIENDYLYRRPFMETYLVGAETTENNDEWVTLLEYYRDTTFD